MSFCLLRRQTTPVPLHSPRTGNPHAKPLLSSICTTATPFSTPAEFHQSLNLFRISRLPPTRGYLTEPLEARPPGSTNFSSYSKIGAGSLDSPDPQARSSSRCSRGARQTCRGELESRCSPPCQPVQIWSSIWAFLHPFSPRRKQPRTLAFPSQPSAAGAARRAARRSSGMVAYCGTVVKRSRRSSRTIPRPPHSEAIHGT